MFVEIILPNHFWIKRNSNVFIEFIISRNVSIILFVLFCICSIYNRSSGSMGLGVILPSINLNFWSIYRIWHPIAFFNIFSRSIFDDIILFKHTSSNLYLFLLLKILSIMHMYIQPSTFIIRILFLWFCCWLSCNCSSWFFRNLAILSHQTRSFRSTFFLLFRRGWRDEFNNMNWWNSIFSCISIWKIMRCWNFITWHS